MSALIIIAHVKEGVDLALKHKLNYVTPTPRGKASEEDTTETPMYVNRGGRLTILQEDQGQLLTLAGEPDGKLRAAGH